MYVEKSQKVVRPDKWSASTKIPGCREHFKGIYESIMAHPRNSKYTIITVFLSVCSKLPYFSKYYFNLIWHIWRQAIDLFTYFVMSLVYPRKADHSILYHFTQISHTALFKIILISYIWSIYRQLYQDSYKARQWFLIHECISSIPYRTRMISYHQIIHNLVINFNINARL